MIVSEKFMPAEEINKPGQPLLHMVLISNDPMPHDPAIKRRLVAFYLHPHYQTFTRQQQIEYQKEIEKGAVSFVILLTSISLNLNDDKVADIPDKWQKPFQKLLKKIDKI